ncbi:MAG: cytochrome c oxidase assembly protein [Rhodospirillales bacterium]|jgi:cytochrome c oxidase assembly protein subunit 11
MDAGRRRKQMTAVVLFIVVGGMVGLSFASVPLYRLFCQVTGYGGTPVTQAERPTGPVSNQEIRISFDANINRDLPWRFKPVLRNMTVRLGEEVLAYYEARNESLSTLTGTAVFNVAPAKAAPYFNKIECFCFTEQTLKAGVSVDMPVLFYVDPAILDDPDAFDVRAITLSYTFYPVESGGAGRNDDKPVRQSANTAL